MKLAREKDPYDFFKVVRIERSASSFIWDSLQSNDQASMEHWIKRSYESEEPRSEEEIKEVEFERLSFFKIQKMMLKSCIKRKDEETLNKLIKIFEGVTVKQFLLDQLKMLESFGPDNFEIFYLWEYRETLDNWSSKLKSQIPEV